MCLPTNENNKLSPLMKAFKSRQVINFVLQTYKRFTYCLRGK